MRYSVEIREGRYIHVLHEGEVSFDDIQKVRKEFSALAATQGIKRILYDGSGLTGNLTTYENYELSATLRDFLPLDGKFALVTCEPHTGDAQFSEDVTHNRGVNMRIFFDHGSALQWLLEENN